MELVGNPDECEPFERYEAEDHRNLYCNQYENCLDRAIELEWKSFSCQRCYRFQYRKSMKEKFFKSIDYIMLQSITPLSTGILNLNPYFRNILRYPENQQIHRGAQLIH